MPPIAPCQFTLFALLAVLVISPPPLSEAALQAGQPLVSVSNIDQLALTTVRVEAFSGDTRVGRATAFFFTTRDNRLFLITNRHVVRKEEDVFFPDHLLIRLHTDPKDFRQSTDYRIDLYKDQKKLERAWKEIDSTIDVVALPLALEDMARKYVFKAFTVDQFITGDVMIGIGEPVIIIGYPLGFYDSVFNLPITRQGAVASVYPIKFQGNRFFLVDAILHAGTSGSPVVTRPTSIRTTKTGDAILGGRSFYLVGVNSGSVGSLNLNAIWFTDVILELTE